MESSEQRIHLSRLRPSANNPRGQLGRADWADLVPSVKEHGVIQPILIRPVDDDLLEIVAGERRYRAANEAFNGEYEIPYVMRDLTDQQALVLATIENMQRIHGTTLFKTTDGGATWDNVNKVYQVTKRI